jgi:hypothetical protein
MVRVVYEELCQYQVTTLQRIFTFLNFNATGKVVDFAKGLMPGPVRIRGDALTNAYRWLSVIEIDSLDTIDRHCTHLYSELGCMYHYTMVN